MCVLHPHSMMQLHPNSYPRDTMFNTVKGTRRGNMRYGLNAICATLHFIAKIIHNALECIKKQNHLVLS